MSEQEALSRRYVAPMVLQLSSGQFAVFSAARELLGVFHEWENVRPVIEAESQSERFVAQPRKAVSGITLEDLGL